MLYSFFVLIIGITLEQEYGVYIPSVKNTLNYIMKKVLNETQTIQANENIEQTNYINYIIYLYRTKFNK